MAWRRNEPCGWASGHCQGSVLVMARKASRSSRSGIGSRAVTPKPNRLPNRPELDELLRKVGLDVRWQPETSTYHRREASILVTSGSSLPKRRTTATSTRKVEITPEMAEARQFEERLRHAYSDGGFLVLTVRPSRMRRVRGRASAAVPAGAGLVR